MEHNRQRGFEVISIPRFLIGLFLAYAYGTVVGYWLGALVYMCR